jgi:hypothetical protein
MQLPVVKTSNTFLLVCCYVDDDSRARCDQLKALYHQHLHSQASLNQLMVSTAVLLNAFSTPYGVGTAAAHHVDCLQWNEQNQIRDVVGFHAVNPFVVRKAHELQPARTCLVAASLLKQIVPTQA